MNLNKTEMTGEHWLTREAGRNGPGVVVCVWPLLPYHMPQGEAHTQATAQRGR